jgi:hypothetical protein
LENLRGSLTTQAVKSFATSLIKLSSSVNVAFKKYNAYERKRWLLCLEDNNLKAKELYQKYNSIESEKIEHPEFYHYWSSDGFLPPSHPVDLKELCQDPIETINNFDPSKCKKATFTDDESLIKDVAKDLTACVVKDPL